MVFYILLETIKITYISYKFQVLAYIYICHILLCIYIYIYAKTWNLVSIFHLQHISIWTNHILGTVIAPCGQWLWYRIAKSSIITKLNILPVSKTSRLPVFREQLAPASTSSFLALFPFIASHPLYQFFTKLTLKTHRKNDFLSTDHNTEEIIYHGTLLLCFIQYLGYFLALELFYFQISCL